MASNPPDDAAAAAAAAAVPGEREAAVEEAAASAAELDLNSASVIAVPPGVPGEVLSETLNDSELFAPAVVGGVGDESSEKGGEEMGHLAGAELILEATSAGGDGGRQHANEVAEAVVSSRENEVSLTGDTKFERGLGSEEERRDPATVAIGDPKDAVPGTDEEKALEEGDSATALIGSDKDSPDASASSGGNMQVGDQEVPKKRGRGRPRLSDAEKSQRIGKKKQSRGTSSPRAKREVRPSSSAAKNTQPASQFEDKDVPAREEQASSKRKRGRPLRYTEEGLELAEHSEDENSSVVEKASSSKRKRGRPKLSKVEDAESSEILEEESSQSGGPSSSLGRPRGRPCHLALDIVPESRYSYVFQDETKDGFTVSDLVWGKVKSHPWWPGQVFGSLDASDAALSIQKKDRVLVAYFGDRTFAWCDESQLKPFQKNFTQMEKQSISHAFVTAVNDSLLEVFRRIELGMMCNCVMNEAYANLRDQKIKNAGIKEGTSSSNVDKLWITNHLEPDRLLEYLQSLAKVPHNGADRMDLVIAKAQLKAFRRSKGHPEVPGSVLGGDSEDDDSDLSSKKENSVNGKTDPSTPVPSEMEKSSGRGGSSMKGQHVPTGGKRQKVLSELMEEKADDDLAVDDDKNQPGQQPSSCSSVKKRKVVDSDSSLGKRKKKSLDSLEDSETKSPSSSGKKGSKVGERVRRVAEMMSGSLSMLKPNSETVKTFELNGDVSRGYSAPSEILSQLHFIALHPLEAFSFLPAVISFFSDFKYWMVSSSSEDVKAWEIVRSQWLNKKPANLMLEREEPDIIQDSYWTDIIISEKLVPDVGKGKVRSQTQKSRKNKKQENVSVCSPPLDLMPVIEGGSMEDRSNTASVTQELDGFDVPVCHSHDKTEEFRPTELVIVFPELDALPNVNELITIFGRYGPLKEGEAEVVEDAKFAKVVFKRCSDAEAAYNHAEKQNIFGQIAVRYSIRVLDSSSKASPKVDDAGIKVDDMRVH